MQLARRSRGCAVAMPRAAAVRTGGVTVLRRLPRHARLEALRESLTGQRHARGPVRHDARAAERLNRDRRAAAVGRLSYEGKRG